MIDTNVTGTLYLIHKVGQDMRQRSEGRILITGSIAGFMPGTYQAVYNGTKALLDSFSFALRAELKDTGVTVTCLMPGDRDRVLRARRHAGHQGRRRQEAAPAEVAQAGFDAMMNGDGDVVAGWSNKLRAAIAHVIPSSLLAEQHRKMAAPGNGLEGLAHTPDLPSSRRNQVTGRRRSAPGRVVFVTEQVCRCSCHFAGLLPVGEPVGFAVPAPAP